MEKPFIDFKFKLGKLNVMSIGPGDMNVGALVSETIKNIVTNLMVFPVKMVVPILYEQDILVSWRSPLLVCVFCVYTNFVRWLIPLSCEGGGICSCVVLGRNFSCFHVGTRMHICFYVHILCTLKRGRTWCYFRLF